MNKLDHYATILNAFMLSSLGPASYILHDDNENGRIFIEVRCGQLKGKRELKHFATYFETFLRHIGQSDENITINVSKTYYEGKITIVEACLDFLLIN